MSNANKLQSLTASAIVAPSRLPVIGTLELIIVIAIAVEALYKLVKESTHE